MSSPFSSYPPGSPCDSSTAAVTPNDVFMYGLEAALRYCVPADLILAIVGAETNFGREMGTNGQGLGQLTPGSGGAVAIIHNRFNWTPDPMDTSQNLEGVAAYLSLMYYGWCEEHTDGTWHHYKPPLTYGDWSACVDEYNGPGYEQTRASGTMPAWMPNTYREFVALHLLDDFVFPSDGHSHGRCSVWQYFDPVGINQPWFDLRTPGLLEALPDDAYFNYNPDPIHFQKNLGCHGQAPADYVDCSKVGNSWAIGRPGDVVWTDPQ